MEVIRKLNVRLADINKRRNDDITRRIPCGKQKAQELAVAMLYNI